MLKIVDLPFGRPVRSYSRFAEALYVSYGGARSNLDKLIAHGVAGGVGGTCPKLFRFRAC